MMRGAHVLQCYSSTQSTVALSGGEAELGGICRGASRALGLKSVAMDLGMAFDIEVLTDATAAIGICRRRGPGKIRHLSTADLWIQERVKSGEIVLTKVAGESNIADALTKHVDKRTLEKHVKSMNIREDYGRAASAPTIEHS